MNEIFKKFNVFDYFSHLVPGAIVVLALLHHFQCKDPASMSNLFGCLYDKLVEHNTYGLCRIIDLKNGSGKTEKKIINNK